MKKRYEESKKIALMLVNYRKRRVEGGYKHPFKNKNIRLGYIAPAYI